MTKTVSRYIVTPDHLWSLHESRPGHVLYEGPGGLYVGLSHLSDASGEYKDVITREDLIRRVRSHPSKVSAVANLYDMRRIAKEMNGATESAIPSESTTPEGVHRFHAVVAGSQPPSMRVVAGGDKQFCIERLDAWLIEHPLGEYEDGLVLEVVHHEAPKPPRTPIEALHEAQRQVDSLKDEDAFDEAVTDVAVALRRLEKIEAAWENTPHDGDPLAAIVAALGSE